MPSGLLDAQLGGVLGDRAGLERLRAALAGALERDRRAGAGVADDDLVEERVGLGEAEGRGDRRSRSACGAAVVGVDAPAARWSCDACESVGAAAWTSRRRRRCSRRWRSSRRGRRRLELGRVGARAVLVDAVAGDVGRARVDRRVGVVAVDVGGRAVAVGVRVGDGLAADQRRPAGRRRRCRCRRRSRSCRPRRRARRSCRRRSRRRSGPRRPCRRACRRRPPPRRTFGAALPVSVSPKLPAGDVLDVGADVGARAGLTPSLATSSSETVHVPPGDQERVRARRRR